MFTLQTRGVSIEDSRSRRRFVTVQVRRRASIAGLLWLSLTCMHASGYQASTTRTAPPVISPPGGHYAAGQTVTITDSQAGAVIYYTADGTTPTTASPQYAGPFRVNITDPIQAIAVAPGNTPSAEVSSFYTINYTLASLTPEGGTIVTGFDCAARGSLLPNGRGPTGTMTLTDTTTNQALGTLAVGTPAVARVFDERTLNSVPDISDSLITADVNGDGRLDVVAGSAGEIAVLLGNGDGTFQPQVSVAGTTGAGTLAAGDFNRDNKLDLVYSIAGTSTFAIVAGNGDGTFSAPQLHSAGTALSGIAVGDFDGDGKLDLAMANGGDGTTGNTILVLLGNGDGTFKVPVSYTVGNGPVAIVAGIFTGSGKLDLAVSNAKDGTVSVLVGNGDGTFQTQVVTQPVSAGQTMAAADFNRDGHLDLAVASLQGTGTVLLGNGDGTFQYKPSLGLNLSIPAAIVAADFSGDGIPDLLIAEEDFLLLEEIGNGDGTFQPQPTFATAAGTFGTPLVLATGDFDGDGVPDFVVSGISPPNGDPSVTFDANDSWAIVSASFPSSSLNPTTTTKLQCSYSGDSNYEASTSPTLSYAFQQLNPPVFSLLVGVYNAPQTVTISDAPGGTIYFTTDGSTPTTASTAYTGPIPISTTTTFKAIAAESGYVTSAVSEALFTFAATPQFSPPGGAYSTGQKVSITDSTPNTTIYYTTDGSTPTTHSHQYSTPIATSRNTTISALAIAANYLNSVVATASYSVNLPATTTALQASATSGSPGQAITLTASVTGSNPTGTVSFSSNGTALGTVTLSNGTATLQTSFAAPGSFPITASYGGDINNAASVSSVVTIVIANSDFSLQSTPPSQTVTSGQVATFTITVSPIGTYTGTVNFSCSGLPKEANCSFVPPSATPTSGPVTTTLMITTTAALSSSSASPGGPGEPGLFAKPMLFASAFAFLFSIRKRSRWSRCIGLLSSMAIAALFGLTLTGCGGGTSKSSSGGGNLGTPAGSYTVSVDAAGGSQGPSHTLSLTLIVK